MIACDVEANFVPFVLRTFFGLVLTNFKFCLSLGIDMIPYYHLLKMLKRYKNTGQRGRKKPYLKSSNNRAVNTSKADCIRKNNLSEKQKSDKILTRCEKEVLPFRVKLWVLLSVQFYFLLFPMLFSGFSVLKNKSTHMSTYLEHLVPVTASHHPSETSQFMLNT